MRRLGVPLADLDHAARAEHGIKSGAGREGGKDAQSEASAATVVRVSLQNVQDGLNKTAIQRLAIVAIVGDHVSDQAQEGDSLCAG